MRLTSPIDIALAELAEEGAPSPPEWLVEALRNAERDHRPSRVVDVLAGQQRAGRGDEREPGEEG